MSNTTSGPVLRPVQLQVSRSSSFDDEVPSTVARTAGVEGYIAVGTRVAAPQIRGSTHRLSTDTAEDRRFMQALARDPHWTVISHHPVAFEARVVHVTTGKPDGHDVPGSVIMSTAGFRADLNAPQGNAETIVRGRSVGRDGRSFGHETGRSMFVIEYRRVVSCSPALYGKTRR